MVHSQLLYHGAVAMGDPPSRLAPQLMVYVASSIPTHDCTPARQQGDPLWLQVAKMVPEQLGVGDHGD